MFGLPLYGCSFQMTQADCYTEMCTFTWPGSGATKGKCIDTAGYISNWEIQQILETPGNDAQQYFSTVVGDIIVYNGTQYISYMTTATYNSRFQWAQSLNFGGVCDWAMDLETSYYGNGTEVGTGSGVVYIDPSTLTEPDATVACEPPCTFVLPPWTLLEPTVISRHPITETILYLYTPILDSQQWCHKYCLWNMEWTNVDEIVIYFPSSSIFPPVILTESPDIITAGTKSTTLAGIIYTYMPGLYPEPSTTTMKGPPPGPPPPGSIGPVHIKGGAPEPTCISGCRSSRKFNCKPEIDCFGICGCIRLGCPGGW
ncbi:hypothetical protein ANO14919_081450 [Xylariales sp. No.14919]|nr:hypothetical protein ANO14919_081450 [Xylariales sp. No.14919]